MSADNQQERLRLPHPWYISGLVDGEGSFHIAFYQDLRMNTHLKIIPEFHLSQNASSKYVLQDIQTFFRCGIIKINHRGHKSDHTYVLVVRNRDDLWRKIIPFFQKYNLRTEKRNDFKIFSIVVKIMEEKLHTTVTGAKQIVTLAYQMNDRGKRRRTPKKDLIKIVESSETIREDLANTR